MPYRIRKHDNKYCVEHKKSGKWSIKQRCSSRENAVKAVKLLHMKGYGSKE